MGFDSEADARDLARTVWGRTHDSRSWVGDLGSRSGVRPVFRGGGVNVNICLTAHETWDLNRGDENKGIQGYTTHLGFTGYVAYLYFLLQHFQLFTPDYTFFSKHSPPAKDPATPSESIFSDIRSYMAYGTSPGTMH